MPLKPIPFGGLAALEGDELIPLGSALAADDCYVDTGQIVGRNGYRSMLPSSTLVGAGSDAPQGLWRFRPSDTSARIVVVAGGHVYLLTDPSAEDASDGALTDLGLLFGATAKISGAQSGEYFYLFSDESPTVSYRITPSYSAEVLNSLDAPTGLTHSLAKPSFVGYGSKTPACSTSPLCYARHTTPAGATHLDTWFVYGHTSSPTRPPQGCSLTFDLGAAADWRPYAYIACAVSPRRSWAGKDRPTIQVAISADGAAFQDIGDVFDGLPEDGAGPTIAYLPIVAIDSGMLEAVRYIRYTLTNAGDVWGTQGCHWAVHGHCLLAVSPGLGTLKYRFSFKDSASGLRSPLSGPDDGYEVTVTAIANSDVPRYHSVSCDKGNGGYEGYKDNGQRPIDYTAEPRYRIANYNMGLAMPDRSDWAGIPTLSCDIPAASQYPNADTVELWRTCGNGLRLAGTLTLTGGETTASVTDDKGDLVLSAEKYQPFGSQQQAVAATSRSGARLVVAKGNRLSISSFIGVDEGTAADDFPSWPPTATDEAHGWACDIAPSAAEQIVSLQSGDYLYVLTNQGVHVMGNVTPNSPAYRTEDAEHGCVGRRAAIYCEPGLVYAAPDGIYVVRGRASCAELTRPIRRLYSSWFAPDETVCIGYQKRRLYAFRGTRYLRFDIATGLWTRGTLAGSVVAAACWYDPGAEQPEQMALLFSDRRVARWQADATSDLMFGATPGTPIPDWAYSTGMVIDGAKSKIDRLLVDADGTVTVGLSRTATGPAEVSKSIPASPQGTPVEAPGWPTNLSYQWRVLLSGANSVTLRRFVWDRSGSDGFGGEKP